MSLRPGLLAALLLGAAALPAWAADYYVAPLGAAPVSSPDGSKDRPFGSVDAALKSGRVTGGDRLLLQDGNHGALTLKYVSFSTPVTIRAENANKARFESILLHEGTKNYTFENLNVWPTNPYTKPSSLIYTWATASNVVFDGLDVRAGEDAANFVQWDATEWAKRAVDGINLNGAANIVRNSRFIGMRFGALALSTDSKVIGNVIDGFSADGIRGNGDRVVVRGNRVSNCVQIDGNHPDAFQAFTTTSINGLIIEGNTILEWTGPKDHPLRCVLQGIGMFDGFYDNLTIQNNVISTRSGHGIAVYGARNAKIVNNTAVHESGGPWNYPWIGVFPHKNGTPSTNTLLANNLAMKFVGETNTSLGNVVVNNRIISNPADVFENVFGFDFRPKASSGFLDVANVTYAPLTDILGNARPSGAGPDLGAYEVGASGGAVVEEPTTGGTAPATGPVATDGTITDTTTEPTSTTDTSDSSTTETPGTTTEPAPTTGTTAPTDSGTTDTSSGTDTTTTTDTAPTDTTTTTTPGRSAGKWSKPLRKK